MHSNPLLWAQKPNFLSRRNWLVPAAASTVLLAVYGMNHVVFHVLAELFTIFIAFMVFFLIWGTHRFGRLNYLMFVAAGYFWVGALDLFHSLYFPGMHIFEESGSSGNHSMQSWLIARTMEASVLLVAPLIRNFRFPKLRMMSILGGVAIASHALILFDQFPDALDETAKETSFKTINECAIIFLLMAGMVVTWLRRADFRTAIWMWMLAAIGCSIVSEFFFFFHNTGNDLTMYLGHSIKILSYWLLFIGVWEVAIEAPYIQSQLLAAAVEQSPSVVAIADKNAKLEYVNHAFTTVTGYSRKEVLGKNPRFLSAGHTPAECYRHMWSILVSGRTWRGLFDNRRKNGSEYTEQVTISSITNDNGAITHYVATKEDVTDKLRAEQYLMDNESALNKTLLGAISAVSELLEARDPYTAGHSKRVSDLAVVIAGKLEIPIARVEGLRLAALLHDIGKIKIPMEILNKPGRLSDEELALVKQHSEVSYQAIKHIPFPMNVPEIIRAHHEKWDGSGYPFGLKGDDIPFESQILSVADVIESVTSHRPYREALGMDAAMQVVRDGRGTYFNPMIVDEVLKMWQEGLI